MKSHRCAKPRGEGSRHSEVEAQAAPVGESCRHVNARGHRCRMPSLNQDASGLCAHHARQRSRRVSSGDSGISDATAAELLSSIEDFSSPEDVNLFLGNVVKQLVRNRIGRRDAVTLAYLSQLLLNSLSAISREEQRENAPRPPVIIMDGIFSSEFSSGNRAENRTPAHTASGAIPPRPGPPEPAGQPAQPGRSS